MGSFSFAECRRTMLAVMTQELGTCLEKEIEVEFCFRILSDIMHFLHGEDPVSLFVLVFWYYLLPSYLY